jgi:hypothetical protein
MVGSDRSVVSASRHCRVNQEMKMLTSVRSLQHPAVTAPRALRVAALLAVVAIAIAPPPPAAAASPDGMDRCQELYALWQRYKGVSTNGSGRDVQSQAALLECRKGRVDAGTTQLEQLLKADRIPVPQVSSAAR